MGSLVSHPPWLREAIDIGKKFDFKHHAPWRHNAFNLGYLALLLALIVAVVLSAGALRTGLYVPLASLVLGFLMMCLFVLVVHEASHNMFLVAKNPKVAYQLNRIFGWAVCIPFGVHYRKHWEEGHILHHSSPMSSEDPMICSPRIGKEFLRHSLKVLLIPFYLHLRGPFHGGGTEFDCSQVAKYGFNGKGVLGLLLFWGGLIALSWPFFWVHWPALLSILLGIQVLGFLTLLKTAVEHGGKLGEEANPYLRQLTSLYGLRHFFLPFKICFHFEHHLYYRVPWYDLGRYHAVLRKTLPEEIQAYFFNRDFWGQMRGTRSIRVLRYPKISAQARKTG